MPERRTPKKQNTSQVGFWIKLLRLQAEFWRVVGDLLWVLAPCRFSLYTLLAAFFFLVIAGQGTEALIVLVEDDPGQQWLAWVGFFLCVGFWALSCWYWARVVLAVDVRDSRKRHFYGDLGYEKKEQEDLWCRQKAFQERWRDRWPRLFGAGAFLVVASAFLKAYSDLADKSEHAGWLMGMAAISAILAIPFYIAVATRRDWVKWVIKETGKADKKYWGGIHKVCKKFQIEREINPKELIKKLNIRLDELGEQRVSEEVIRQIYKENDPSRIRNLPETTNNVLISLIILSIILWIFAAAAPVTMGQWFGAAALMFMAVANMIPAGSLLAHFGVRHRAPYVLVAVLLMVVFSFWNDNHTVRNLRDHRDVAKFKKYVEKRPSLTVAFEGWKNAVEKQLKTKDGRVPFIIVATAGGATRAAYFTASVLGRLEDEIDGFHRHVFAISGVSGGSLGGAVYRALLQQDIEHGGIRCGNRKARNRKINIRACGFEAYGQEVTKADFMGPLMAGFLYTDVLQWGLPFSLEWFNRVHLKIGDRAAALEKSWEVAWRNAMPNVGKKRMTAGADRFENEFVSEFVKKGPWIPRLFLNGTSVKSGRRLIASDIRFTRCEIPNATDLLRGLAAPISFSTAVDMSTRFPIFTPAGVLTGPPGSKVFDAVVDGGYYENFGATTAYDILFTLVGKQNGREKDVATKKAFKCRPIESKRDLNEPILDLKKYLPVVIQISTDPSYKGTSNSLQTSDKWPADDARPPGFLRELTSILGAFLAAREARGHHATAALKKYVEGLGGKYFEFRLCQSPYGKRGPKATPLGWQLSGAALAELRRQLPKPKDKAPICDNLAQVEKLKELFRR